MQIHVRTAAAAKAAAVNYKLDKAHALLTNQTEDDVAVDEAVSVDPGFSIGALLDVLEDRLEDRLEGTPITADRLQLSFGGGALDPEKAIGDYPAIVDGAEIALAIGPAEEDLATLLARALQTNTQSPAKFLAAVAELLDVGDEGGGGARRAAIRKHLADSEGRDGSLLAGRSCEALLEALGAPEDIEVEHEHLLSDYTRFHQRFPEGTDHQYQLTAEWLRRDSDDDNNAKEAAPAQEALAVAAFPKAAAGAAVAILVAEGGEEHPLADAADSEMVTEMLDQLAAGAGPLRVDVPFCSATVGKATVLMASTVPAASLCGAVGLAGEGIEDDPQLLDLWQCANFLMLPTATRMALAARHQLSLVDGVMGSAGGGSGAAVPIAYYNALVERHLGFSAECVVQQEPDDHLLQYPDAVDTEGEMLTEMEVEDMLAAKLNHERAALVGQPRLSWAELYTGGEGGALRDGREEQGEPDDLAGRGNSDPWPAPSGRVGSGRRHRLVLRDNIQGITDGDITDLLRQAGVLAAEGSVYQGSRDLTRQWLEGVVGGAVRSTEHRRGRVVTAADCGHGLAAAGDSGIKSSATVVYGYGLPDVPAGVWSLQLHKVLKQVHPDTEISAEGLAVADDYISDLMRRLVACAAQLSHEPVPTAEEVARGDRCVLEPIANQLDPQLDQPSRAEAPMLDPAAMIMVELDVESAKTDGRLPVPAGIDVIGSRELQTAVRSILPGELAKHAVSEGTKAATKFNSRLRGHQGTKAAQLDRAVRAGRSARSSNAGLQFSVEATAALASKACRGVLLSEAAAVYLAAVLEYMVAELLELGGNAARNERSSTIFARHLAQAVRNDEELARMTTHVAIRGGGVKLAPVDHLGLAAADKGGGSGFDGIFAEMVTAAPDQVLIDPRDGRHYTLVRVDAGNATAAGTGSTLVDEDDAIIHRFGFQPSKQDPPRLECSAGPGPQVDAAWKFARVPALDLAAMWPRRALQAAALACLSPAQRAAFDADAPQLRRRIAEIRQAGQETALHFLPAAWARLVAEVGQDFKTDLRYTAEAMDCLQVAAEAALRRRFATANQLARHAGRVGISRGDLKLAAAVTQH